MGKNGKKFGASENLENTAPESCSKGRSLNSNPDESSHFVKDATSCRNISSKLRKLKKKTPLSFVSRFGVWMRMCALVLVLIFVPEQVSWAFNYNPSVLWGPKVANYIPVGANLSIAEQQSRQISNNVLEMLGQFSHQKHGRYNLKLEESNSNYLDKNSRNLEILYKANLSKNRLRQYSQWLAKPAIHPLNCGVYSMQSLLDERGIAVSLEKLSMGSLAVDILGDIIRPGDAKLKTSMYAITKTMDVYGVNLHAIRVAPKDMDQVSTPFIAHFSDEHFVTVTEVKNGRFYFSDVGEREELSLDEFIKKTTGYLLVGEGVFHSSFNYERVPEDLQTFIWGSKWKKKMNESLELVGWKEKLKDEGISILIQAGVTFITGGLSSIFSSAFLIARSISQIAGALATACVASGTCNQKQAFVLAIAISVGLNCGINKIPTSDTGSDLGLGANDVGGSVDVGEISNNILYKTGRAIRTGYKWVGAGLSNVTNVILAPFKMVGNWILDGLKWALNKIPFGGGVDEAFTFTGGGFWAGAGNFTIDFARGFTYGLTKGYLMVEVSDYMEKKLDYDEEEDNIIKDALIEFTSAVVADVATAGIFILTDSVVNLGISDRMRVLSKGDKKDLNALDDPRIGDKFTMVINTQVEHANIGGQLVSLGTRYLLDKYDIVDADSVLSIVSGSVMAEWTKNGKEYLDLRLSKKQKEFWDTVPSVTTNDETKVSNDEMEEIKELGLSKIDMKAINEKKKSGAGRGEVLTLALNLHKKATVSMNNRHSTSLSTSIFRLGVTAPLLDYLEKKYATEVSPTGQGFVKDQDKIALIRASVAFAGVLLGAGFQTIFDTKKILHTEVDIDEQGFFKGVGKGIGHFGALVTQKTGRLLGNAIGGRYTVGGDDVFAILASSDIALGMTGFTNQRRRGRERFIKRLRADNPEITESQIFLAIFDQIDPSKSVRDYILGANFASGFLDVLLSSDGDVNPLLGATESLLTVGGRNKKFVKSIGLQARYISYLGIKDSTKYLALETRDSVTRGLLGNIIGMGKGLTNVLVVYGGEVTLDFSRISQKRRKKYFGEYFSLVGKAGDGGLTYNELGNVIANKDKIKMFGINQDFIDGEKKGGSEININLGEIVKKNKKEKTADTVSLSSQIGKNGDFVVWNKRLKNLKTGEYEGYSNQFTLSGRTEKSKEADSGSLNSTFVGLNVSMGMMKDGKRKENTSDTIDAYKNSDGQSMYRLLGSKASGDSSAESFIQKEKIEGKIVSIGVNENIMSLTGQMFLDYASDKKDSTIEGSWIVFNGQELKRNKNGDIVNEETLNVTGYQGRKNKKGVRVVTQRIGYKDKSGAQQFIYGNFTGGLRFLDTLGDGVGNIIKLKNPNATIMGAIYSGKTDENSQVKGNVLTIVAKSSLPPAKNNLDVNTSIQEGDAENSEREGQQLSRLLVAYGKVENSDNVVGLTEFQAVMKNGNLEEIIGTNGDAVHYSAIHNKMIRYSTVHDAAKGIKVLEKSEARSQIPMDLFGVEATSNYIILNKGDGSLSLDLRTGLLFKSTKDGAVVGINSKDDGLLIRSDGSEISFRDEGERFYSYKGEKGNSVRMYATVDVKFGTVSDTEKGTEEVIITPVNDAKFSNYTGEGKVLSSIYSNKDGVRKLEQVSLKIDKTQGLVFSVSGKNNNGLEISDYISSNRKRNTGGKQASLGEKTKSGGKQASHGKGTKAEVIDGYVDSGGLVNTFRLSNDADRFIFKSGGLQAVMGNVHQRGMFLETRSSSYYVTKGEILIKNENGKNLRGKIFKEKGVFTTDDQGNLLYGSGWHSFKGETTFKHTDKPGKTVTGQIGLEYRGYVMPVNSTIRMISAEQENNLIGKEQDLLIKQGSIMSISGAYMTGIDNGAPLQASDIRVGDKSISNENVQVVQDKVGYKQVSRGTDENVKEKNVSEKQQYGKYNLPDDAPIRLMTKDEKEKYANMTNSKLWIQGDPNRAGSTGDVSIPIQSVSDVSGGKAGTGNEVQEEDVHKEGGDGNISIRISGGGFSLVEQIIPSDGDGDGVGEQGSFDEVRTNADFKSYGKTKDGDLLHTVTFEKGKGHELFLTVSSKNFKKALRYGSEVPMGYDNTNALYFATEDVLISKKEGFLRTETTIDNNKGKENKKHIAWKDVRIPKDKMFLRRTETNTDDKGGVTTTTASYSLVGDRRVTLKEDGQIRTNSLGLAFFGKDANVIVNDSIGEIGNFGGGTRKYDITTEEKYTPMYNLYTPIDEKNKIKINGVTIDNKRKADGSVRMATEDGERSMIYEADHRASGLKTLMAGMSWISIKDLSFAWAESENNMDMVENYLGNKIKSFPFLRSLNNGKGKDVKNNFSEMDKVYAFGGFEGMLVLVDVYGRSKSTTNKKRIYTEIVNRDGGDIHKMYDSFKNSSITDGDSTKRMKVYKTLDSEGKGVLLGVDGNKHTKVTVGNYIYTNDNGKVLRSLNEDKLSKNTGVVGSLINGFIRSKDFITQNRTPRSISGKMAFANDSVFTDVLYDIQRIANRGARNTVRTPISSRMVDMMVDINILKPAAVIGSTAAVVVSGSSAIVAGVYSQLPTSLLFASVSGGLNYYGGIRGGELLKTMGKDAVYGVLLGSVLAKSFQAIKFAMTPLKKVNSLARLGNMTGKSTFAIKIAQSTVNVGRVIGNPIATKVIGGGTLNLMRGNYTEYMQNSVGFQRTWQDDAIDFAIGGGLGFVFGVAKNKIFKGNIPKVYQSQNFTQGLYDVATYSAINVAGGGISRGFGREEGNISGRMMVSDFIIGAAAGYGLSILPRVLRKAVFGSRSIKPTGIEAPVLSKDVVGGFLQKHIGKRLQWLDDVSANSESLWKRVGSGFARGTLTPLGSGGRSAIASSKGILYKSGEIAKQVGYRSVGAGIYGAGAGMALSFANPNIEGFLAKERLDYVYFGMAAMMGLSALQVLRPVLRTWSSTVKVKGGRTRIIDDISLQSFNKNPEMIWKMSASGAVDFGLMMPAWSMVTVPVEAGVRWSIGLDKEKGVWEQAHERFRPEGQSLLDILLQSSLQGSKLGLTLGVLMPILQTPVSAVAGSTGKVKMNLVTRRLSLGSKLNFGAERFLTGQGGIASKILFGHSMVHTIALLSGVGAVTNVYLESSLTEGRRLRLAKEWIFNLHKDLSKDKNKEIRSAKTFEDLYRYADLTEEEKKDVDLLVHQKNEAFSHQVAFISLFLKPAPRPPVADNNFNRIEDVFKKMPSVEKPKLEKRTVKISEKWRVAGLRRVTSDLVEKGDAVNHKDGKIITGTEADRHTIYHEQVEGITRDMMTRRLEKESGKPLTQAAKIEIAKKAHIRAKFWEVSSRKSSELGQKKNIRYDDFVKNDATKENRVAGGEKYNAAISEYLRNNSKIKESMIKEVKDVVEKERQKINSKRYPPFDSDLGSNKGSVSEATKEKTENTKEKTENTKEKTEVKEKMLFSLDRLEYEKKVEDAFIKDMNEALETRYKKVEKLGKDGKLSSSQVKETMKDIKNQVREEVTRQILEHRGYNLDNYVNPYKGKKILGTTHIDSVIKEKVLTIQKFLGNDFVDFKMDGGKEVSNTDYIKRTQEALSYFGKETLDYLHLNPDVLKKGIENAFKSTKSADTMYKKITSELEGYKKKANDVNLEKDIGDLKETFVILEYFIKKGGFKIDNAKTFISSVMTIHETIASLEGRIQVKNGRIFVLPGGLGKTFIQQRIIEYYVEKNLSAESGNKKSILLVMPSEDLVRSFMKGLGDNAKGVIGKYGKITEGTKLKNISIITINQLKEISLMYSESKGVTNLLKNHYLMIDEAHSLFNTTALVRNRVERIIAEISKNPEQNAQLIGYYRRSKAQEVVLANIITGMAKELGKNNVVEGLRQMTELRNSNKPLSGNQFKGEVLNNIRKEFEKKLGDNKRLLSDKELLEMLDAMANIGLEFYGGQFRIIFENGRRVSFNPIETTYAGAILHDLIQGSNTGFNARSRSLVAFYETDGTRPGVEGKKIGTLDYMRQAFYAKSTKGTALFAATELSLGYVGFTATAGGSRDAMLKSGAEIRQTDPDVKLIDLKTSTEIHRNDQAILKSLFGKLNESKGEYNLVILNSADTNFRDGILKSKTGKWAENNGYEYTHVESNSKDGVKGITVADVVSKFNNGDFTGKKVIVSLSIVEGHSFNKLADKGNKVLMVDLSLRSEGQTAQATMRFNTYKNGELSTNSKRHSVESIVMLSLDNYNISQASREAGQRLLDKREDKKEVDLEMWKKEVDTLVDHMRTEISKKEALQGIQVIGEATKGETVESRNRGQEEVQNSIDRQYIKSHGTMDGRGYLYVDIAMSDGGVRRMSMDENTGDKIEEHIFAGTQDVRINDAITIPAGHMYDVESKEVFDINESYKKENPLNQKELSVTEKWKDLKTKPENARYIVVDTTVALKTRSEVGSQVSTHMENREVLIEVKYMEGHGIVGVYAREIFVGNNKIMMQSIYNVKGGTVEHTETTVTKGQKIGNSYETTGEERITNHKDTRDKEYQVIHSKDNKPMMVVFQGYLHFLDSKNQFSASEELKQNIEDGGVETLHVETQFELISIRGNQTGTEQMEDTAEYELKELGGTIKNEASLVVGEETIRKEDILHQTVDPQNRKFGVVYSEKSEGKKAIAAFVDDSFYGVRNDGTFEDTNRYGQESGEEMSFVIRTENGSLKSVQGQKFTTYKIENKWQAPKEASSRNELITSHIAMKDGENLDSTDRMENQIIRSAQGEKKGIVYMNTVYAYKNNQYFIPIDAPLGKSEGAEFYYSANKNMLKDFGLLPEDNGMFYKSGDGVTYVRLTGDALNKFENKVQEDTKLFEEITSLEGLLRDQKSYNHNDLQQQVYEVIKKIFNNREGFSKEITYEYDPKSGEVSFNLKKGVTDLKNDFAKSVVLFYKKLTEGGKVVLDLNLERLENAAANANRANTKLTLGINAFIGLLFKISVPEVGIVQHELLHALDNYYALTGKDRNGNARFETQYDFFQGQVELYNKSFAIGEGWTNMIEYFEGKLKWRRWATHVGDTKTRMKFEKLAQDLVQRSRKIFYNTRELMLWYVEGLKQKKGGEKRYVTMKVEDSQVEHKKDKGEKLQYVTLSLHRPSGIVDDTYALTLPSMENRPEEFRGEDKDGTILKAYIEYKLKDTREWAEVHGAAFDVVTQYEINEELRADESLYRLVLKMHPDALKFRNGVSDVEAKTGTFHQVSEIYKNFLKERKEGVENYSELDEEDISMGFRVIAEVLGQEDLKVRTVKEKKRYYSSEVTGRGFVLDEKTGNFLNFTGSTENKKMPIRDYRANGHSVHRDYANQLLKTLENNTNKDIKTMLEKIAGQKDSGANKEGNGSSDKPPPDQENKSWIHTNKPFGWNDGLGELTKEQEEIYGTYTKKPVPSNPGAREFILNLTTEEAKIFAGMQKGNFKERESLDKEVPETGLKKIMKSLGLPQTISSKRSNISPTGSTVQTTVDKATITELYFYSINVDEEERSALLRTVLGDWENYVDKPLTQKSKHFTYLFVPTLDTKEGRNNDFYIKGTRIAIRNDVFIKGVKTTELVSELEFKPRGIDVGIDEDNVVIAEISKGNIFLVEIVEKVEQEGRRTLTGLEIRLKNMDLSQGVGTYTKFGLQKYHPIVVISSSKDVTNEVLIKEVQELGDKTNQYIFNSKDNTFRKIEKNGTLSKEPTAIKDILGVVLVSQGTLPEDIVNEIKKGKNVVDGSADVSQSKKEDGDTPKISLDEVTWNILNEGDKVPEWALKPTGKGDKANLSGVSDLEKEKAIINFIGKLLKDEEGNKTGYLQGQKDIIENLLGQNNVISENASGKTLAGQVAAIIYAYMREKNTTIVTLTSAAAEDFIKKKNGAFSFEDIVNEVRNKFFVSDVDIKVENIDALLKGFYNKNPDQQKKKLVEIVTIIKEPKVIKVISNGSWKILENIIKIKGVGDEYSSDVMDFMRDKNSVRILDEIDQNVSNNTPHVISDGRQEGKNNLRQKKAYTELVKKIFDRVALEGVPNGYKENRRNKKGMIVDRANDLRDYEKKKNEGKHIYFVDVDINAGESNFLLSDSVWEELRKDKMYKDVKGLSHIVITVAKVKATPLKYVKGLKRKNLVITDDQNQEQPGLRAPFNDLVQQVASVLKHNVLYPKDPLSTESTSFSEGNKYVASSDSPFVGEGIVIGMSGTTGAKKLVEVRTNASGTVMLTSSDWYKQIKVEGNKKVYVEEVEAKNIMDQIPDLVTKIVEAKNGMDTNGKKRNVYVPVIDNEIAGNFYKVLKSELKKRGILDVEFIGAGMKEQKKISTLMTEDKEIFKVVVSGKHTVTGFDLKGNWDVVIPSADTWTDALLTQALNRNIRKFGNIGKKIVLVNTKGILKKVNNIQESFRNSRVKNSPFFEKFIEKLTVDSEFSKEYFLKIFDGQKNNEVKDMEVAELLRVLLIYRQLTETSSSQLKAIAITIQDVEVTRPMEEIKNIASEKEMMTVVAFEEKAMSFFNRQQRLYPRTLSGDELAKNVILETLEKAIETWKGLLQSKELGENVRTWIEIFKKDAIERFDIVKSEFETMKIRVKGRGEILGRIEKLLRRKQNYREEFKKLLETFKYLSEEILPSRIYNLSGGMESSLWGDHTEEKTETVNDVNDIFEKHKMPPLNNEQKTLLGQMGYVDKNKRLTLSGGQFIEVFFSIMQGLGLLSGGGGGFSGLGGGMMIEDIRLLQEFIGLGNKQDTGEEKQALAFSMTSRLLGMGLSNLSEAIFIANLTEKLRKVLELTSENSIKKISDDNYKEELDTVKKIFNVFKFQNGDSKGFRLAYEIAGWLTQGKSTLIRTKLLELSNSKRNIRTVFSKTIGDIIQYKSDILGEENAKKIGTLDFVQAFGIGFKGMRNQRDWDELERKYNAFYRVNPERLKKLSLKKLRAIGTNEMKMTYEMLNSHEFTEDFKAKVIKILASNIFITGTALEYYMKGKELEGSKKAIKKIIKEEKKNMLMSYNKTMQHKENTKKMTYKDFVKDGEMNNIFSRRMHISFDQLQEVISFDQLVEIPFQKSKILAKDLLKDIQEVFKFGEKDLLSKNKDEKAGRDEQIRKAIVILIKDDILVTMDEIRRANKVFQNLEEKGLYKNPDQYYYREGAIATPVKKIIKYVGSFEEILSKYAAFDQTKVESMNIFERYVYEDLLRKVQSLLVEKQDEETIKTMFNDILLELTSESFVKEVERRINNVKTSARVIDIEIVDKVKISMASQWD